MAVTLEILQKGRANLVRVHLIYFTRRFGPPGPKPRVYLAGLETLARQAADDPRNGLPIEIGARQPP